MDDAGVLVNGMSDFGIIDIRSTTSCVVFPDSRHLSCSSLNLAVMISGITIEN